MKYIIRLSVIVIILSLGVTALYKYSVVRYLLIVMTIVFAINKRSFIIKELVNVMDERKLE